VADVSVGDAWLPEFRGRQLGEAVIIARTVAGEKALDLARKNGALSLKAIPSTKVKASQAFALNFKKENLLGRLSFLRMVGKTTPRMDCTAHSSRFLGFIGGFLSYLSFRVSSSKRLRFLLLYAPLPLFRLYFGLFKCVFLLSPRVRS
jgi:hypothetical protein